MNSIFQRDNHRLTLDAERIRQQLEGLEREFVVSIGHRDGEDSVDLMEELKEVEVDVSLMLTDYIAAGCTLGEDAPKVVFHDFRGIFSCLDALFSDLKEARMELENACTQGAIADHLGIDWARFQNILGQIQSRLSENPRKHDIPSEGIQVHPIREEQPSLESEKTINPLILGNRSDIGSVHLENDGSAAKEGL